MSDVSISKILVPIDGSDASWRALVYAFGLGRIAGAEIHVCYALDYVALPGPLGPLEKAPETAPDLLLDEGERLLARARALARQHEVETTGHLVRGTASQAILRLAKELGVDLIVMGTHGRTGLRRLVLGSVAERVLGSSQIPVVLLRAQPNTLA